MADDATCFPNVGSDKVVADIGLMPLANNGGPTQTMALKPGSPAIDAVVGACAVTTDQRGHPPARWRRQRHGSLRRGAFESLGAQRGRASSSFGAPTFAGPARAGASGRDHRNPIWWDRRDRRRDADLGRRHLGTRLWTTWAPCSRSCFGDGETSKTLQIPIINDAVAETDESVVLTLGSPTGGGTIGTTRARPS